MVRSPTLAGYCFLLAVSTSLAAGEAEAQVRVTGTAVTEDTGAPLDLVAVTLFDADGTPLDRSLTGEAGRFAFRVEDADGIRLLVERIGYQRTLTPIVPLEAFEFLDVEVRLSPEALQVDPLEVVASGGSTSPMLEDFEHRREKGFGHYITRTEIQDRSPGRVSDMLRTVPGVRVGSAGRGARGVITMGHQVSARGPCPADIWVDGFHVNRADGRTFRIDDVVAPEEVEGIEVYRGGASAPAEFLDVDGNSCGTVVIWTRRGGS